LTREHRAPEPPRFIAGILAYMAPKQTGRMTRLIDSRTDLSAFGATLYELLPVESAIFATNFLTCGCVGRPLGIGPKYLPASHLLNGTVRVSGPQ
jgi:hypothetical protein